MKMDVRFVMDKKDPVSSVRAEDTATTAELRKPHEMIVMLPRSQRVTLTARRLYSALLQVSQTRMSAMEVMPAADFMFEAPLAALLRKTGSNGGDRVAARRYLREMRGLEVDWESIAPGDGVKWRGFSMLSEVAIEQRSGENWVLWSYPPTIMSALRNPERWARIDLDVLARLSSYASVALYEICARYRGSPSGLTSKKTVQWWTDALSQAPPGSEHREWRKFKSERIKPAITEINEETDIEIELIENKSGRTVIDVQFAVRLKGVLRKAIASESGPIDANLILRAETLGIREIKVDSLIKEFGEDMVRAKVGVLERRATNNSLKPIESAYSYLRSLLRNDEPDDGQGITQKVNVTVPSANLPPMPSAKENAWLNERMAAIKNEIAGLEAAQRQSYADRAMQHLSSKGLLTPVVARRAAQGDYLHGVIGAMIVRIYADEVYGQGWDKQPIEQLLAT